jgi:hypothetical protein
LNCEFAILESETLLHISGPDTLDFLQGQTTCDTRLLNESSAVPGAYCTPQGRVVCDFLLLQLGAEHVALRLRRDILEAAAGTFGKYIVFSKAELDAGRDDWQVACCWGEDARDVVRMLCGSSPSQRFGTISTKGMIFVQMDDEGRQFECYLDRSLYGSIPPELAQLKTNGGEEHWRALQIIAGAGRVEAATVGTFIPQMLNYDITGQISFNKGCYTGQEVVARLHYRGKSKRRMYLARFDSNAQAAAGTELYTAESPQAVGNLVNRARGENGEAVALVVATVEGIRAGLCLGSAQGLPVTVGELPYAVDAE